MPRKTTVVSFNGEEIQRQLTDEAKAAVGKDNLGTSLFKMTAKQKDSGEVIELDMSSLACEVTFAGVAGKGVRGA